MPSGEPSKHDDIFHAKDYDTSQVVDLKMDVLRSDMKRMKSDLTRVILASVALNQFLANVALPHAVTIPAFTAAIFAPALKSVLAVFTRS